jgi:hypothetical protein
LYLRCLLFELCSENSQVFFEVTDRDLLFFHSLVLFQEFVQQHRIHCLVPHGIDFAILIAHDQLRIYLFYLLGYQPKLRNALGIYLLLVTEGDRLERRSASLASFIGLMSSLKRRDEVTVPSLPFELTNTAAPPEEVWPKMPPM